MPNVSLPTINSSLELFEAMGILRRLATVRGAVLYDPHTEPHDHLICERCGAVSDIDAGVELDGALARARGQGFEVSHAEVSIRGPLRELWQ